MRLTLITVCFNSEKIIATALESVLRQRDVDFEYIVVDGASRDGTLDIIKSYEPRFAGRMHHISERDSGMYDALNKGVAMATGDVVGILNADDVLASDRTLADVAAAFDDNTDAVYADIRFVKADTSVAVGTDELDYMRSLNTLRYYSAKHWRPWMLRWGFMPPHPGVYIRREFFAKLGGYKLDYKIAADYELLVRYLKRNALRTKYINKALVVMRMGGMSTNGWRSTLTLNRENVRANRENGYWTCILMMVPKYAFKIWEFCFTHDKR